MDLILEFVSEKIALVMGVNAFNAGIPVDARATPSRTRRVSSLNHKVCNDSMKECTIIVSSFGLFSERDATKAHGRR